MSTDALSKNKKIKHTFLLAAKLKCEADVANAMAKIDLYNKSSVGVGDHPNIVGEIYEAARQGAEAQDVLDFLNSL